MDYNFKYLYLASYNFVVNFDITASLPVGRQGQRTACAERSRSMTIYEKLCVFLRNKKFLKKC